MARDYSGLCGGICLMLVAGGDLLGINPPGFLTDIPVVGHLLYGRIPFGIGVCLTIYATVRLLSDSGDDDGDQRPPPR